MLSTERAPSRGPKRRQNLVERDGRAPICWVPTFEGLAPPGIGVVAEHDTMHALAAIAPRETVMAAKAAKAASIRLLD